MANHDSPKSLSIQLELHHIKKSRPNCKLNLVLLLLASAVSFACVSFISPIAQLYSSEGETFHSEVSIKTHLILQHNPLKVQLRHNSDLKSNPQNDGISCSSLINGIGRNYTNEGRGIMCCDRSHFRTDVCYLKGDVRTHFQLDSILLKDNTTVISHEEKIRPYTRKWEDSVMNTIDQITLRRPSPQQLGSRHILCQVQHSVPAIVFSTGGYTGNVYHEFNDGLLPLYITSQHLHGEVMFVILEYHDWWMSKYQEILKQLTRYPVIDVSRDKQVHCFPEMVVGLKIHDELSINPGLMKDNKTIQDFRVLLSKAYASRLETMVAPNVSAGKPLMVIISRNKSRVLLNQKGIVKLAQKIGFHVEIVSPKKTTEMVDMFRVLNACDVMVGVHGAAMTHFLFMRPGSVFIQIVPLGTDWAAATYYGEPASKLGLKYMDYKILPEESSLSEKYERDDDVLRHPERITSKGWWETKRVYLDGQNVRPSLKRFKKTLLTAYASSVKHTNSAFVQS